MPLLEQVASPVGRFHLVADGVCQGHFGHFAGVPVVMLWNTPPGWEDMVAAIIEKNDLLTKANVKLPLLMEQNSPVQMYNWNVPKSVATQCSFLHRGKDYIITASGGVDIDGFAVAENNQVVDAVKTVHQKASPPEGNRWWW